MSWMLKNSEGKPDAMFTFAVFSWVVTVFCIVAPMLNGTAVPYTSYVFRFVPPETSLVVAFLAAGFTSYVVRRNAKLKADLELKKNGHVMFVGAPEGDE